MKLRPPSCKICASPDATLINMEMGQGYEPKIVALAYGVSLTSLKRHWYEHVLKERSEAGMEIVSMHDVLDIPMQMKQRGRLLRAMIDRTLAPMYADTPGTVDDINTGFLINLLKLQQYDEAVMMRVTGVWKGDVGGMEPLAQQQYVALQDLIEGTLAEVAQGDSIAAGKARIALADRLMPLEAYGE